MNKPNPMNVERDWKLFDDGNSAIVAGTPFRVAYFLRQEEHHLYFATKEEAFVWVQSNPTLDGPEIEDLKSGQMLYPKDTHDPRAHEPQSKRRATP